MKKETPIDENDLSGVSGGVTCTERAAVSIDEGCNLWTCNVCGNGLRSTYLSDNTAPSCKHYAFTSCRNCQYFNVSSSACGKRA